MGYDRGFVLVLVDDSTNNSSTHIEPKPHIVNRTSPLTRAMPNLHSFSSHQNKNTGETPLTFCTFTLHHIRKVLIRDRLPKNGFLMEELIIQTTEKNFVVRDWSLKIQKEKGDSLVEGCIANLPEHVTVNWDSDTKGIFVERYGDIANLIAINVDKKLIQAMVRFWDPAYQCFTFNQEDMTPTIEEYAALLRINNVQFYKIYVKEPKPMTFKKKLMRLTDMIDTWAKKQIKKKNETSCIPWFSLRNLVLNHPDMLKRVNLFALAIYGLIVFPRVLRHIEVAVVDFFEKLKQGINPVPTILAETFRSLSICRRKGEGHFIGCAQLLNV
ncbi:hypothetical protein CXB51_009049 [Gossypium anomalum]|uniref:DUF7745 domain-containing protein n=1 Tax=Gossypium anomalum TaxID=47600 RepID=A0A8J5ZC92_9ROSI|nr:hypothetical protein CXB51_009049 [Gossypium anomalum]